MNTRTSTMATWLSCGVGFLGIVFIVATSLMLGGCVENDPRPRDGGDDVADAGGGDAGVDGDDGTCVDGETRPADDGCNTCSCIDGEWACTLMACLECTPGETRPADDGCNTCTCTDGFGWACTEMACTECEPGTFRGSDDGCHLCECEEDGTWACPATMDCPGYECLPGESRDEDCNTCVCDDNGFWLCTGLACPECEPGDTFSAEDGCDCVCDDAGFWDCDDECGEPECAVGDVIEDGCEVCRCADGAWDCIVLDEEECGGDDRCEPGAYRVSDNGCHLCECDRAGAWICPDTLDCPGVECLPGETRVSEDGCTDCFCTDDGLWSCALPGPECAACEPGDTREADDGCNQCTCTDDGSWACTEIACPPQYECESHDDCFETGCSGQFCASVDIPSTCEWLPEYACYGEPVTPCGCVDGFCAWTDTEALEACLADPSTP